MRLVYPSLNCKRDPAILSGLPHEADDLVVRGVDHGHVVDGDDLVAGEQPAVQISCSSRNDMTN